MDAWVDPAKLKQRELVVRVATLELLVADLVHLLRQVAPEAVDESAAEAARDLTSQVGHDMPSDAEHQRFRLQQVLSGRARALASRRFSQRLAAQRFAPTD
ncbi:MAG TPA: hypothetical protein VMU93_04885 [Caulobacteraceae bacterium]|nr:hypothetical protein [Caulobacteraceae bacterium]